MLIELSEKEFLSLVYSRIRKAQIAGDINTLREHQILLEQHKRYSSDDMVLKYYTDTSGSLYLIPYSKEEYTVLLNKYRESGIW